MTHWVLESEVPPLAQADADCRLTHQQRKSYTTRTNHIVVARHNKPQNHPRPSSICPVVHMFPPLACFAGLCFATPTKSLIPHPGGTIFGGDRPSQTNSFGIMPQSQAWKQGSFPQSGATKLAEISVPASTFLAHPSDGCPGVPILVVVVVHGLHVLFATIPGAQFIRKTSINGPLGGPSPDPNRTILCCAGRPSEVRSMR